MTKNRIIDSTKGMGDRIYASNNEYGIPTLLLEAQPESSLCSPVSLWGHKGRSRCQIMTYLFYLSDREFKGLIGNPHKIIYSGCTEVVELNLTVNDMTPRALAIERTYQKRYVSRLLQECDIKVWIDLNVSRRQVETNLLGVPQGYNAFATRGYDDRIKDLEFEYRIAQRVSGSLWPNFIVYGGGKKAEKFCIEHNAVYIPEYMTERHKKISKRGGLHD